MPWQGRQRPALSGTSIAQPMPLTFQDVRLTSPNGMCTMGTRSEVRWVNWSSKNRCGFMISSTRRLQLRSPGILFGRFLVMAVAI